LCTAFTSNPQPAKSDSILALTTNSQALNNLQRRKAVDDPVVILEIHFLGKVSEFSSATPASRHRVGLAPKTLLEKSCWQRNARAQETAARAKILNSF